MTTRSILKDVSYQSKDVGALVLTEEVRDPIGVGVIHLTSVLLDDLDPRLKLRNVHQLLIISDVEHASEQTEVFRNCMREMSR